MSICKLIFGYLFRPKVVITIIIPQMIQHKSFEFQKKMIMLQKEKWQVAHVIPKVAHANIFVSENVSVSNSWFDLSSLSIFLNWPYFWCDIIKRLGTWNIFWPPNDFNSFSFSFIVAWDWRFDLFLETLYLINSYLLLSIVFWSVAKNSKEHTKWDYQAHIMHPFYLMYECGLAVTIMTHSNF